MPVLPLHLPVLLLMVASVTFTYQYCKAINGEKGIDRFLREHHDQSESSGNEKYCDQKMHENCMTDQDPPKTKCKETNSFIHASKNQIQDICKEAGSPYKNNPNMRVSNEPFSITTCKIQGDAAVHPCEYKGSAATRRMVVVCEDELPTHFEEEIVVPQ